MNQIKAALTVAVLLALLPVEVSAQDRCPVEKDRELAGSKANTERREKALENEKARSLNPRTGPVISGMFVAAKMAPGEEAAVNQARYIPHLAQGHGWETYLDVLNTCAKPVEYRIRFFGADGRPTEFEFGEHGRFSSIHQGKALLGKSIDTFHLTDTGAELLIGAGMVVEDSGGCVAVDTFYAQARETAEGEKYYLYATVPLSRMAAEGVGLTFTNTGTCETHMAIAGTGGGVRIEALKGDDSTLGSLNLDEVHHTAFSVGERLPGSRGEEGILRIRGEAAVLGMDFCQGNLMQFRLPHLVPAAVKAPEPGSSPEPPGDPEHQVVAESFSIERTGRRGSVFGEIYTYGISLRLRNPTVKTQVYTAKVQFRDADGFLVMEKMFWPGRVNGPLNPCPYFCKEMLLGGGALA